jgi:hypothetical protein
MSDEFLAHAVYPRSTAWAALRAGLVQLVGTPAVTADPEVAQFISFLAYDVMADIPADATMATAMQKLAAGFRRQKKRSQDEEAIDAKAWVQEEWKRYGANYKGKADFSRIYAALLRNRNIKPPRPEEIAERWLRGL